MTGHSFCQGEEWQGKQLAGEAYQCHTQETGRTTSPYSKGEPSNLLVVCCKAERFKRRRIVFDMIREHRRD